MHRCERFKMIQNNVVMVALTISMPFNAFPAVLGPQISNALKPLCLQNIHGLSFQLYIFGQVAREGTGYGPA